MSSGGGRWCELTKADGGEGFIGGAAIFACAGSLMLNEGEGASRSDAAEDILDDLLDGLGGTDAGRVAIERN